MSKEMREQIDRVKNFKQFINESINISFKILKENPTTLTHND